MDVWKTIAREPEGSALDIVLDDGEKTFVIMMSPQRSTEYSDRLVSVGAGPETGHISQTPQGETVIHIISSEGRDRISESRRIRSVVSKCKGWQ